jgi:excinuclease ABC subunit B
VRPAKSQVDDLLHEVREVAKAGYRSLVTTLTKRMAEDLTEYMHEAGIRVRYMHSDIETLERIEIIRDLRLGAFDVLIGINLLREGLDIPECGLVAILDADKEGFLRSETSLIQTIGRAARNVDGKVLMYADTVTDSMRVAISETQRRRKIQMEYNAANGIDPQTVRRKVSDILLAMQGDGSRRGQAATPTRSRRRRSSDFEGMPREELERLIRSLEEEMHEAAKDLRFEYAARLRDEVQELRRELSALREAGVG